MPVTASCPACQTRFEVADDAGTPPLTCPSCGAAVGAPVGAPAEVLPHTPQFRVVTVSEERDLILPPRPAPTVELPPELDLRRRDALGLTGCLVRLAALGAICLATAAGMLVWGEASLVIIALYATCLLVVVSICSRLLRNERQPAARVFGAVILAILAVVGLVVLVVASFLFLVSVLVNLGPSSRYPY